MEIRKLKFRAWDKYDKKMCSNVAVFDNIVFLWTTNGERESLGETEGDRFIPMQYTGLDDKNGVEIYEGDIVKTRIMFDYNLFSEDEFIEVKFEYGQFNPMCLKKKTPYRILPQYYDFEVVDNIYEKLELINKDKK